VDGVERESGHGRSRPEEEEIRYGDTAWSLSSSSAAGMRLGANDRATVHGWRQKQLTIADVSQRFLPHIVLPTPHGGDPPHSTTSSALRWCSKQRTKSTVSSRTTCHTLASSISRRSRGAVIEERKEHNEKTEEQREEQRRVDRNDEEADHLFIIGWRYHNTPEQRRSQPRHPSRRRRPLPLPTSVPSALFFSFCCSGQMVRLDVHLACRHLGHTKFVLKEGIVCSESQLHVHIPRKHLSSRSGFGLCGTS
jgi:hypothetical protein